MRKFTVFLLIFKFVQCFGDPTTKVFNNNTINELNSLYEKWLELIAKVPDALWMIGGSNPLFKHQREQLPIELDLPTGNDVNTSDKFNYGKIIESNKNSTGNKCNYDLIYMAFNIEETWAVQMLDSAGKLPSGLLLGNMFWMGEFSECRNVTVPLEVIGNWKFGNFRGEYCYITWNIAINSQKQAGLPINIGICVPDSCTEKILLKDTKELGTFLSYIPAVKKILNYTANGTQITCKSSEEKWKTGDIAYMCILGIFGVLIVIGTLCDLIKTLKKKKKFKIDEDSSMNNEIEGNSNIFDNNSDTSLINKEILSDTEVATRKKENCDSGIVEFFICFSVYTNGAKICNTTNNANQLNCIHGIRFLSMSWVILGHTFLSSLSVVDNMTDVLDYAKSFYFQLIAQGTFSVDTFFLLSGVLLSYLFLKRSKEENENINWIYYYLHRIWRLTPAMAMVLGFYITIWIRLGTGPLWPKETENGHCRQYWWWNILYIQNFKSISEMCMAWTWYLANDMQFYVISPLFLILLWKFTIVGIIVINIILGISFIVTIILSTETTNIFSLLSSTESLQSNIAQTQNQSLNFFDTLYDKPWCRIGPYLIGIFTGYALYKVKDWEKLFNKTYLNAICWIIAILFGTSVIFGVYHSDMGKNLAAIYNGFSRTTWSIAVAWIIFACVAGFGGIINRILCWNMWIPLSRLTYTAYLIHPLIIGGYYNSVKKPLHFKMNTIIMNYFGFLLASYLAAFVVSIAFESPLMALEKFVLGRFSKKKKV